MRNDFPLFSTPLIMACGIGLHYLTAPPKQLKSTDQ